MRTLWRVVRWVLAGIVGLALIVAVAVGVFTRTARFNDLLRVRLVGYLAQTYRGQIMIGSIEGSIWGSLTLRDIEMRHGGSDIVSISQLRVGYQILPALRRQLVLSDIDVIKPELHLARDSDGRWNLLAAIAERNPAPPSPGSDITIALRRLAIEQAAVSVATAPSVTYRLRNGNLNGSGNIDPSGQSFKVDTITLALSGPGMLPMRVQGTLDYYNEAQIATIKVPSFSISTDRSRIDLSGTLRDFSAKNVDTTVNLRKLAAADLNSLAPQANLARDLSGTLRINANAADLHGVVALAAGDARLNTSLKADISKSKPIWSIQAHLAKVDLRKLLKRKNPQELPAGVINAAVRADGIGTSIASAEGAMDARVSGLALSGMRLGDVSLAAAVKDQVASLKVALAGPSGGAQLSGRVAIAKQPVYNLHPARSHLRPGSLIHVAGIPPADLNLTSTIDGSGYQPRSMRTRVQLRWLPSTLGAIQIDGGHVDAQLASGIVQIADASLRAGGTSVGANGQLALNPNGSGRIRYAVLVGQASDWLGLAGRKGSGRIDLTGQAQGNLQNLRTSGSVDLSSLRVDRYSVAHARLTYDIAGLGKPLRPDGQLMLTSTDLRARVELKSLQTSIRLIPGVTQTAVVNLSAEDRGSHPASMHAEVTYKPNNVVVNLSQMAVTTSDGCLAAHRTRPTYSEGTWD